MNWNVAEAKQRLSEVLRAAHDEPQRIFNRQRFVAAVIDSETFEAFQRWREQVEKPSVGERFAELRKICAEEGGWQLEVPERVDRRNEFAEALKEIDNAALRHERHR